jgi:sensor histidine kinase regulating citrate/malate metabolism
MLKNAPACRIVNINVTQDDNHFYIQYDDSGPGLSVDIIDPDQVFECFYTTKRNARTGEKIGTGIGMWLVKSVVEDNDGVITFTNIRPGIGMKIKFPKKFKKG